MCGAGSFANGSTKPKTIVLATKNPPYASRQPQGKEDGQQPATDFDGRTCI